MADEQNGFRISRRALLKGAGATGLAAALPIVGLSQRRAIAGPSTSGTPEQVHLTWGSDPRKSVVVSWASPGEAANARATVWASGGFTRTVPAVQRIYTDGLNGDTVWTYHATLHHLAPGTRYQYAVTADNDANAADPFSASFTTAPAGRAPFRFTSFGDLSTPNTAWVLSYGQSVYAVDQVNAQKPLFHLLNGDLCYANLNPKFQPQVWADFNNNNQRSAAFLPWMPCDGNHEIEFDNGPQGLDSYLTRYTLPGNGVSGFEGRWYSFRIGSVQFVSLAADDVIYQDAAAFVGGPAALVPASSTGNPPIPPGTSLYVHGYSGGRQTAWLAQTLAAARKDESIDWIVVQMHECALSSSITGNGSDLGIRQEWLGLFDRYEVDLVLCGHDHDYERSYPVR
ncbi:MAG: metallophosphoesterase family protein, partial [Candidatus Dormibacteraeota bacterium]|nr:metallophosphoesterase family protein [Candidatus Dormibacteraeota bacterium]